MGQYETSSALLEIGVISGKDMTTEAAITKLMFLLGQDNVGVDFKKSFETALRGEIQEQFIFVFILHFFLSYLQTFQRGVRVVEGASLESLYMGNCIEGSNPFLSAE